MYKKVRKDRIIRYNTKKGIWYSISLFLEKKIKKLKIKISLVKKRTIKIINYKFKKKIKVTKEFKAVRGWE